MGFIEDLYYENIDAQAYSPEFGAELKQKLNGLTNAFISGFRLGAKFTHDTFI